MNRRTFAATVIATPLLSSCFWSKHFDITWEEEVQLHDGRVIVAKVKHNYERLRAGFTRYGGKNILRGSAIAFDAGGSIGWVTQELKAGWPISLEQVDGVWFLVFYWASRWSPSLLGGQDWGQDQNGYGQFVAVLHGKQFRATSFCSLPERVQRPNLLLHNSDLDQLASLNSSLISLQTKRGLDEPPRGPYEARIERPSGVYRCDGQVNNK